MTTLVLNLSYRNPITDDLESNPIEPPDPGDAILLSRLDLSGGVPTGDGPGLWGFGFLTDANLTVVNDGTNTYLRGQYPVDSGGSEGSGAPYIYGGYALPELHQEVYVTIYARMPGPYRQGCKFCKFFGQRLGSDYANTTFATDYSGTDLGSRQYIAWGDGTFDQNDDGNGVGLDEAYPINTGRNGSLTKIIEHGGAFDSTEWGSGWHKWQIRARFNSGTTSGNEINDGAYEEHIDGVLRAKAINVFSRNPINHFYDSVQFFGYARGATSPWELHIRDITVSLNGWID